MVVGILGTLVGLVLYGAATLQARVLPRWYEILLILLMPDTILLFGALMPGNYSIIWNGLVWVALGYALWSHSSSAAT